MKDKRKNKLQENVHFVDILADWLYDNAQFVLNIIGFGDVILFFVRQTIKKKIQNLFSNIKRKKHE